MDSVLVFVFLQSLPGLFWHSLFHQILATSLFFFFLTHCDLLIFILTNDLLLILERFILLTFYSALSMMGTNGQPVTKAGGRSLCFPLLLPSNSGIHWTKIYLSTCLSDSAWCTIQKLIRMVLVWQELPDEWILSADIVLSPSCVSDTVLAMLGKQQWTTEKSLFQGSDTLERKADNKHSDALRINEWRGTKVSTGRSIIHSKLTNQEVTVHFRVGWYGG